MKTSKTFIAIVLIAGFGLFVAISQREVPVNPTKPVETKVAGIKGCVFKTVFGEEEIDSAFFHPTPDNMHKAVINGLKWIETAQQKMEDGELAATTIKELWTLMLLMQTPLQLQWSPWHYYVLATRLKVANMPKN